MQIDDYKYASIFIENRRLDIKDINRIVDKIRHYYDVSTNITSKIGLTTGGTHNFSDSKIENAIVNMAEYQNKELAAVNEFMKKCEALNRIGDPDGAYIIYKYCILGKKMDDISKEVMMSKRTCYRHLDIAVEELDYYLMVKYGDSFDEDII